MITEERVTHLEATLARFIDQTSIILAEIHEDIAESRASNARTDRQLLQMQQQAEKRLERADKERQEWSKRFDEQNAQADKDREASAKRFDEQNERYEKERQAADKAHQEWSKRFDEQNAQADKDREATAKRFDEQNQRYEKERKESNKRWAEISDSMGTLIEDMVAPCGFQLAKAIFDDEEAQTCAIRIKRKHPAKPGQMMELDLLAIGPTKVLVVEAKRRMDATKVKEYRDKVRLLSEFFPELAGKTVCPAVASVYLEASVITLLNREKLHGIAMGDETMQVVNLGAF